MLASDLSDVLKATVPWSPPWRMLRNLRLVATSTTQHLVDDPALLAIQVSRRLPFPLRVRLGDVLQRTGPRFPALGALGAFIAGRQVEAEALIQEAHSRDDGGAARLAGEVAILLDQVELIPVSAPPATRARAAWSRGEISRALRTLNDAGPGVSRYRQRLRSEYSLLQPGFRVVAPQHLVRPAGVNPPRSGEALRVLHLVTNSLPDTQSGYSLRTHRILTALKHRGIDSVALTRTGYPVMVGVVNARDEEVVDGIRYVRTLPSRLPQTQQQRLEAEVDRALELVDEFRPHVLHTTTNYLNALVAQAVSEATRLPWVFEVRGLMERTWAASHRTEAGRREAETSERFNLIAAKEAELARDADAVVTIAATMADVLGSRGVDREIVEIVPNGVDSTLLAKPVSTREARRLTGLDSRPQFDEDAYLVGAVSALVDYEGYDVLLRAVAIIVDDKRAPQDLRSRIAVVLAGDGAARPDLRVLAEELGLRDRALLPGRVPRDEARRWVEALDVVIVPRLDVPVARAVTPQKPIEALALGRQLIISDLPALREVVTVPNGTVLARSATAGDPRALAREITAQFTAGSPDPARIEQGRELARQHQWPELVRRYESIYHRLTASPGEGEADEH